MTGVIGQKTLEICREFPERFEIIATTAHSQEKKLLQVTQENSIPSSFITSPDFKEFHSFLQTAEYDRVVVAGLGTSLFPLIQVILRRGKSIALATKEIVVAHGEKLFQEAQKYNGEILPIDSEISAVWQCLLGEKKENIRRIFLTASGGPFWDSQKFPLSVFPNLTPEQVVKHPKWKMGEKISVDSATLVNKAFELIELVRFFQIPPEKIEVVIHPSAEIHSAVEFCDGSIKAQISNPEMKIPLARALFFPDIPPSGSPSDFSFFGKKWEFFPVDSERFPSIQWARQALLENKCLEFLQENDAAVEDFLLGKIRFDQIFSRIQKVFEK